jgi:serine-type D-Ala-D-Ala carboxypeptidase/endopeptidase (penicillin-binding protein 4)
MSGWQTRPRGREDRRAGVPRHFWWTWVCCALTLFAAATALGRGASPPRFQHLMGARDACLLAAPNGRFLVSVNPDMALIPASTLKILTSLTAYHYLGEGYHFKTDLYLDDAGNLKVKGYGDPLLISEVLARMATSLRQRLCPRPALIRDLVLDTSFFSPALHIPGVSQSFEPFDAPNGALCANFNTVAFRRRADGTYVSAEPQTPLLPSVMPRIREARESQGRILLTNSKSEAAFYMGHLFAYFLRQAGIQVTGKVRLGSIDPASDTLLLSYRSPFSLDDTISKLLAFSNNFIANQLLIASGAKAFGAPGSLAKGLTAARAYVGGHLGIKGVIIVEGSGISHKNHISARSLFRLLKVFSPHHGLMRQTARAYYKTGTLHGISTRVGFFKGPDQRLFPFVVMLNSSPQSMGRILDALYSMVQEQQQAPTH